MGIEKLEKILEDCQKDGKSSFHCFKVESIFIEILNTFKDQSNQIIILKKRVKKLEQSQTYYPTEEYNGKIDIKVGGTD